MKITGSKAYVFFDSFDESRVISGAGMTLPGQWYFVLARGTATNLPCQGTVLRAPASGAQISLVAGDKLFPIDRKRFCKTSADLSAEQGTVDAGDDCDPGASILDGIISVSGSLAGLFNYDETTGDFDLVTDEVVNRFFDIVEDNGMGQYSLRTRNDDPITCCAA